MADFYVSFSICSLWDMEIQLNYVSTDLAKFYTILFNVNRQAFHDTGLHSYIKERAWALESDIPGFKSQL